MRAMFDRIAGVYDVMNTAMTAGLHHRWRARAADLAARAARAPRARRRDRHRRPRDRARARASRPGGEVIGSDFSEAMLDRAREAPQGAGSCARASSGPTRSRCRTPTTASTPRRSASARATSPTSSAASPRWRASCVPAGASSCSRSRTPRASRRCRASTELWFDRLVPAGLGRVLAGDGADAYSYLPAELGQALPGAARARRGDGARGPAARSATCCSPAGSSRSTSATVSRSGSAVERRRQRARRRAGRDVDGLDAIMRRGGAPCASAMVGTSSRACASHGRRGEPLSAYAHASIGGGGKRLRPLLVVSSPACRRSARRAGRRASACCAPPSPSSSSTRRRSCTTTCSTTRRCAAGAPPSSPPPGATSPTATGDLLFSRAFAELARNGERDAAARALGARARRSPSGELMQRDDA